jgi:dihydroorotase/N-acyl-D-amino-acid deacylase
MLLPVTFEYKTMNNFSIAIINGTVIDGAGGPAFEADVFLSEDRIAFIGKSNGKVKADRIIDARGLVVSPGFIDMMGQSEEHVLIDPRAMSKVMQGITTEITGEGSSIAPMNERLVEEQSAFLERYGIKVDWRDLDGYFNRLERQGVGLNIGTYIGATQVRAFVIGYDNRPPSDEELDQMKRLVAETMRQGAFGLSSSLQYVPARFASADELIELAKVARTFGGIYATHQRSEGNAIFESLDEVFKIARRASIPTEIFHLKCSYKRNWTKMREVIERIEAARVAEGLDITADVYPYTAASTSLKTCLPVWALEGGIKAMLARLRDAEMRERIKREILIDSDDWENIFLGSNGAEGVLICATGKLELEHLNGKSLAEIALVQNKEPLDAALDLLIEDEGQTDAIYFMMSEDDLRLALRAPFTSICTDSRARAVDGPLSTAKAHPRAWGAFPRVLARYVRDEKLLTLDEAVHKMAGLPARRVGLGERGLLREGYFADIVLFDPDKVQDLSTFTEPNQYPRGIPYVIINGQIVVDDGQHNGKLAGTPIRH